MDTCDVLEQKLNDAIFEVFIEHVQKGTPVAKRDDKTFRLNHESPAIIDCAIILVKDFLPFASWRCNPTIISITQSVFKGLKKITPLSPEAGYWEAQIERFIRSNEHGCDRTDSSSSAG